MFGFYIEFTGDLLHKVPSPVLDIAEPARVAKATVGNDNRANGVSTHARQSLKSLTFGLDHQPLVCPRAIAFFDRYAVEGDGAAIAG